MAPGSQCNARFAKWRDDGTLEAIFHALSADADMENLSLDSTCIRVHESANGGGKTADKAVGRTRGVKYKAAHYRGWTGEPG